MVRNGYWSTTRVRLSSFLCGVCTNPNECYSLSIMISCNLRIFAFNLPMIPSSYEILDVWWSPSLVLRLTFPIVCIALLCDICNFWPELKTTSAIPERYQDAVVKSVKYRGTNWIAVLYIFDGGLRFSTIPPLR
jgi:hypothetical protein